MNMYFGEIRVARYCAHDRPLLNDTKAFAWKAALYLLNQALLAFRRTRSMLSIAGQELGGCLGIFEFQSKNL
ncbi:hypothetical protein SAMN04490179_2233 [Pseudomonas antarctica]|uniref:Uncharacterized protein n=1 Tax=Pseudomonas antarctica TaxID=219572 RepID=A0A1G9Y6R6_9PSED|nr:hypothetical protein PSAN_28290 [Pseudomonas antarctica]SDN04757.1 hypothetical protein SAMN04490179_2233 [Pseudomonas antarctica]